MPASQLSPGLLTTYITKVGLELRPFGEIALKLVVDSEFTLLVPRLFVEVFLSTHTYTFGVKTKW